MVPGYYNMAQICINGHVINLNAGSIPVSSTNIDS